MSLFNLETSLSTAFPITEEDFNYFKKVVFDRAGIQLTWSRKELVTSRFARLIKNLNLTSFKEYRSYLEKLPPNHPEWQNLINEITTNKTDFFREKDHFEFLTKEYLPCWNNSVSNKTFKSWTAACSSGEEPYTLAMVLDNFFSGENRYKILASDIDTKVLETAKAGIYNKSRITDVPEAYRRYFAYGTKEIANWVKVKDALKQKINFEQVNLLTQPYKFISEPVDLIMCRNVFIYFNSETIEQIVNAMYEVTKPGGILMIGHSESLLNIKSPWKSVQPAVFRK